MIESIYLLLDSLYCSQLRDFLSGYNCQTESFTGANVYNELGIGTLIILVLMLGAYYKVIDPSENKRLKWGVTMLVSAVFSALFSSFWAMRAETKGLIGQCLLKDDQGNSLISFMDYVGLGISNAIIIAIAFFAVSLVARYLSVNNRCIPF